MKAGVRITAFKAYVKVAQLTFYTIGIGKSCLLLTDGGPHVLKFFNHTLQPGTGVPLQ